MNTETITSNDSLITANTEQILANQSLVYEAGQEAGQRAECDKFWDNYQNYGNRTNYEMGFLGYGFNFNTFHPKYDIKPIGSGQKLFYAWNISADSYDPAYRGSLKQRLEECGVILDTSKVNCMTSMFRYGRWTELPTIDMTGLTTASDYIFANNYGALKTIEKIIIGNGTPIKRNWFGANCQGLENLIIEGTIGKNGFDVQYQTELSGESIVSIIEALSSTASGLTVTLSQTAVDNITFPITSTQTGTIYASWDELVGTKTNWTIALA